MGHAPVAAGGRGADEALCTLLRLHTSVGLAFIDYTRPRSPILYSTVGRRHDGSYGYGWQPEIWTGAEPNGRRCLGQLHFPVCVFDGAPAMLHFYNHRRAHSAHSALGGLPPISRLTDLTDLTDLPDLPGRHS